MTMPRLDSDGFLIHRVVAAFREVYNRLGVGFLEPVYARALEIELRERGLEARREVAIDVSYKGAPIGSFRVDLMVEGRLIVELKAGGVLSRAAHAQLANYVAASACLPGVLLHFGERPYFRVVSPRRCHTDAV